MDAIAAWLKNPSNYFAGLDLLKAQAGNTFTIDILSSGPDSYNTPKLYQELKAIYNKLQSAQAKRIQEKPEELKRKDQSAAQLMDRRAELKAQLRFLKDDEKAQDKRKEIAFEILRIGSQLDKYYEEQDFYMQHGYVPSGEFEADDDPVQLKSRQLTVRTYIVRYKNKNPEKLRQYEEELAILNKKLEKYGKE